MILHGPGPPLPRIRFFSDRPQPQTRPTKPRHQHQAHRTRTILGARCPSPSASSWLSARRPRLGRRAGRLNPSTWDGRRPRSPPWRPTRRTTRKIQESLASFLIENLKYEKVNINELEASLCKRRLYNLLKLRALAPPNSQPCATVQ